MIESATENAIPRPDVGVKLGVIDSAIKSKLTKQLQQSTRVYDNDSPYHSFLSGISFTSHMKRATDASFKIHGGQKGQYSTNLDANDWQKFSERLTSHLSSAENIKAVTFLSNFEGKTYDLLSASEKRSFETRAAASVNKHQNADDITADSWLTGQHRFN